MMALFPDAFDALSSLQQALDSFRSSSWLASGPSGGGSYPPMNVFRKGDDFIIITEVPGVKKSDLQVQVKGNTIRLSGSKSVTYPDRAGVHRRERLSGRFDRAMTLPVEINADGVKAECRDGILALYLPRAERDKPRSVQVL
jgi:HSP20 family protein